MGHVPGTPGPVRGREALKQLIAIAAYFAAFDVHDTPEFLVAEGDMVVIHDTYRLKHKGEFQGIPPTGKEANITGTDIYRIADGQIVEQWGVLPTPGHGGKWTFSKINEDSCMARAGDMLHNPLR